MKIFGLDKITDTLILFFYFLVNMEEFRVELTIETVKTHIYFV